MLSWDNILMLSCDTGTTLLMNKSLYVVAYDIVNLEVPIKAVLWLLKVYFTYFNKIVYVVVLNCNNNPPTPCITNMLN